MTHATILKCTVNQTALEIARSLVVGYIEEDDDVDTQDETDRSGLGASSHSDSSSTRRRRSFSSASGGGGGGEISDDSGGFSYRNMLVSTKYILARVWCPLTVVGLALLNL